MKILLRHHRSISYHDLHTNDTTFRSVCDVMNENTCSNTSSGNDIAISHCRRPIPTLSHPNFRIEALFTSPTTVQTLDLNILQIQQQITPKPTKSHRNLRIEARFTSAMYKSTLDLNILLISQQIAPKPTISPEFSK
ncbi:hypothetical protein Hanom_Chr01g00003551 [Helianthus anomalus]